MLSLVVLSLIAPEVSVLWFDDVTEALLVTVAVLLSERQLVGLFSPCCAGGLVSVPLGPLDRGKFPSGPMSDVFESPSLLAEELFTIAGSSGALRLLDDSA